MLIKIKAVLSSIWADIKDTYSRIKIYLVAILGLIIYFEWARIKAALLVAGGQKEIKSDQKQDQVLAQQETQANTQADALVKKAESETAADDWNKK